MDQEFITVRKMNLISKKSFKRTQISTISFPKTPQNDYSILKKNRNQPTKPRFQNRFENYLSSSPSKAYQQSRLESQDNSIIFDFFQKSSKEEIEVIWAFGKEKCFFTLIKKGNVGPR